MDDESDDFAATYAVEEEPITLPVEFQMLGEEDMRLIFEAKCLDFGIKFTDKLYNRFVKHQNKKSLRKTFEMESCSLGARSAKVISSVLFKHPNFKVIRLSGNSLGDLGALDMADLLLQTNSIISLDLSSNSIGDEGAASLFNALRHNMSVAFLHVGSVSGVSRNSFGNRAINELSLMFHDNRILSEINLSMTEISTEDITILTSGLSQNKTLKSIHLSNNNLRSKGAVNLLNGLLSSQIAELYLGSNHLKDDCAPYFANFLSNNKSLKKLDLSGNNLTHRFTSAIALPLASQSPLIELNLSRNPLGGRGVSALGPALITNVKLENIDFSGCKLEPSGFTDFCDNLKRNTALLRIHLDHNSIRDDGAMKLSHVIAEHPTLKEIDLELCEIADEGANLLFPAIAKSKSIEKISVKNNLIHNGILIQHALADNPHIRYINIDYNDIDFKVYEEIQRTVTNNLRSWKLNHKQRVENEVNILGDVETKLADVRHSIIEERELIEILQKSLKEAQDNAKQAEISKNEKMASLEAQLEEIENKVSDYVNDCRQNHEDARIKSNAIESEVSALSNRLNRETDQFKVEIKSLANLETKIRNATTSFQKSLDELNGKIKAAQQLYNDNMGMVISNFNYAHQINVPIEETKAENETPKKGKKDASSRKPSPKKGEKKSKKAKGKGKGKGKGKEESTKKEDGNKTEDAGNNTNMDEGEIIQSTEPPAAPA